MKRKTSRAKLVISVLLCAGILAGCSAPAGNTSSNGSASQAAEEPSGTSQNSEYQEPPQDSQGVLKLSCMANETEKIPLDEAIERFQERYPGVTVEPTYSTGDSWQDYSSKLVVQMTAGNAPDIVGVAIEGTRMMVSKNVLEPLNSYLENDPDGAEMQEDITQSTWDAFTVDGKIYEVPKDSNIVIMFYNTKMFEEAGITMDPDWTWEDFVDIAQQLTTGDGEDKVWGFMIRNNITSGYLPWLTTNNTNLLNPELTASNLTDPKVEESFQFMYDLVYKYKVAPVPDAKTDLPNMFAAGRVAMIPTGMFVLPTFKDNNFTDYAIAPLPKKESHDASFGTGGLGIVRSCENKDLAWELVKEMTSAEFALRCAELQTTLPVRKSAAESEAFQSIMPNVGLFYEELEHASAFPCPNIYPDMTRIVTNAFDAMMTNQASAADALAAADSELTKTFEDANN